MSNGDAQNKSISETAMVLAAGLGMRMRPLTLSTPKPLLKVGGKALIDYALDKLVNAGIKRAVVNTFYLAEQIEAHLAARKDIEIIISRENELLDTGGGIKNALHYFGEKPFFVFNADLPWFDEGEPSLERMKKAWNPEAMDILLLVMPTAKARGFPDKGDFMMESNGRLWRKNAPHLLTHVWISAQIMKPQLILEVQEKVFSNNMIFDVVEEKNKLFGIVHEGSCYHVGTPSDFAEANRLLETGKGWSL